MNIEHIIVLVLENRSFDHMLGFLNHPDPTFPKLSPGDYSNPWPGNPPAEVDDDARYQLAVGPGHHHQDVKQQLKNGNQGFVKNYKHRIEEKRAKARKKLASTKRQLKADLFARSQFRGSVAYTPARKVTIRGRIKSGTEKKKELEEFLKASAVADNAGLIMQCFDESRIPVLSTLAKEFCVFTNWHASVPGMTWPNRGYAIAATSDGEVNIVGRTYKSRTIFEDLSDANKSWAIYHDGPSHTWAYPNLWFQRGDQYKKLSSLPGHISDPAYQLPSLCFVEPNHGLKFGPLYKKRAEFSNSQHPGKNVTDIRDFIMGEQLIADIYNALKSNPARFKKTLFLITYDEHGGFFDNRVPPSAPAPGDKVNKKFKFDFKSLGVRVPAVAVCPWIKAGSIDDEVRDHSSIPKTCREIFIGDQDYLSKRERWVKPFHGTCSLARARSGADLPEVVPIPVEEAAKKEGLTVKKIEKLEKNDSKRSKLFRRDLDEFEQSMIAVASFVEEMIEDPEITTVGEVKWRSAKIAETGNRFTCDADIGNYVESVSRLIQEQ